jgi:hypothetical protein
MCAKIEKLNLVMLKSSIFPKPVIVGFDAIDPKFVNFGANFYYDEANS